MKKFLLILAASFALAPLVLAADPTPAAKASPTPPPADEPIGPLKNQKDKVSYAIGLDIGSTLKRQLIDVNEDLMSNGIKDGLSGAKPLMNEDQVKQIMTTFQKDMMARQAEARKEKGEKNETEGKKFLEENKKKDGVKTTASGLQYKVDKEGTGSMPKATDTVKVNYRGTLIDGTEFDSSFKRGQPASFPVNRVIKGWTEGLQLMKTGSKYHLFVPSELAYGERGAGGEIGPNATLIFDVELLSIEAPTPTPKPAAYDSSRPAGQPGAAKPVKPMASPNASASPSPTARSSDTR